MLGRYSLDKPGLVFAGGDWDTAQYVTYPADKDGVLPITDDEYFTDDAVSMFIQWVKTVFGADDLEVNLKYIASALYPNGGGTARADHAHCQRRRGGGLSRNARPARGRCGVSGPD